MASEPTRIYWDSCCYISCIEKTPDRYDALRKVIDEAVANKIVLVASTLIIAEVVRVRPGDPGDGNRPEDPEGERKIVDFFKNDYIRVRQVTRKIAEDARKLSREFKLKPADAIHVATAIDAGCPTMHTYDGFAGCKTKLLAFNGKIGIPPLEIIMPCLPFEQSGFAF